MKIAVYTIAKNEAQFVERWAESAADADYRLILDTGSTDDTVALATQHGAVVHAQQFTPWRFDHARNAALALLPDDIDLCIALDMDEVLQPGWRECLEAMPTGTTRPRYKYVWSWNDDGTEGLTYGGDKIHARHGYYWKHPVHEVITPTIEEHQAWVQGLEIHHHPDPTKSRSQYFDLLRLAVEEDPDDDRNQFYLGREYVYRGEHSQAIPHFEAHLRLSRWAPERCASRRFLAKCDPTNAERHLWAAVSEDSRRREPWVELAQLFYESQDWLRCLVCCRMALGITEKPLDYLCEAFAWGSLPYDLGSIAAYYLGSVDESLQLLTQALALDPTSERLSQNLEFVLAAK